MLGIRERVVLPRLQGHDKLILGEADNPTESSQFLPNP